MSAAPRSHSAAAPRRGCITLRQFLKTTAAAALVVAAPAFALARAMPTPAPAPALVAPADDTPPKDDEKKNEVTVWVLDASGKG